LGLVYRCRNGCTRVLSNALIFPKSNDVFAIAVQHLRLRRSFRIAPMSYLAEWWSPVLIKIRFRCFCRAPSMRPPLIALFLKWPSPGNRGSCKGPNGNCSRTRSRAALGRASFRLERNPGSTPSGISFDTYTSRGITDIGSCRNRAVRLRIGPRLRRDSRNGRGCCNCAVVTYIETRWPSVMIPTGVTFTHPHSQPGFT